jgi:hypothetical protein
MQEGGGIPNNIAAKPHTSGGNSEDYIDDFEHSCVK